MERLKITITDGYENDFIEFCKEQKIEYRQYPLCLNTRFGVTATFEMFDSLPYVYKCEKDACL